MTYDLWPSYSEAALVRLPRPPRRPRLRFGFSSSASAGAAPLSTIVAEAADRETDSIRTNRFSFPALYEEPIQYVAGPQRREATVRPCPR